jgi:hypothetical protein
METEFNTSNVVTLRKLVKGHICPICENLMIKQDSIYFNKETYYCVPCKVQKNVVKENINV